MRGWGQGTLILLLFLFPLFLHAANTSEIQQRPASPAGITEKQTEAPRPILDAPSLRIPAHPPYQTTLQTLGYKSPDDLLKQTLQAHNDWVRSVAFDGNGQLASGSDDGTVKIWDAHSGQLKQTLQAQSSVWSVAFDANGQLASGSVDGSVKIWDIRSGQLKQTLQHSAQISVWSVAFDANGQLASGAEDGTVKIWNAQSGQLKQTLQVQSVVYSVAFDGNGQLAFGSSDGTVKIWDAQSGQLKQTLQAQSSVWSVAFDANGQLASGSDDGTVKIWNAQSGQLKQTLQAQSSVRSVAFDANGQLASGSDDGTVKIWDAQSGQLKQTLQAQSHIWSAAFDANGQLASGSSDGTVKIWDAQSGQLKQTLQAQSRIWSVAFDANGQLASGSEDGTVKIWDAQSGQLKQTLQAQSSVWSVAFDANGQLASGSEDGTVKIWDAQSGQLKQTLQAQSSVWSVAFDTNGQLASGSEDGSVKIWDANSGQLKQTLQAQDFLNLVTFDANGQLASDSEDGSVKIWDAQSGQLRQTLQAQGFLNLVAFDANGQLSSGFKDGSVKIWDAQSGQLKQTLQAQSSVLSMAFDNNGQLASGSEDGSISIWDTQSGQLKQTLQAQSSVWSVAFDANGQLASGSEDGSVNIWDTSSGDWISSLVAGTQGFWFSLFNNRVLVADGGTMLRIGNLRAKTTMTIKAAVESKDGEITEKVVDREITYRSWFWNYLAAPNSHSTHLQPRLEADSVELKPGSATLFTVSLSNTGNTPIHRPRILETSSTNNEIQIIPAEYQPTYPQTTAIYSITSLILPGETIELAARVISTGQKPVASGEYEIPVIIEVSGGEQTAPMLLKVQLNTPDVIVTASDYSSANNTLNIQLENRGTATLPQSDFYLIYTGNRRLTLLPRQSLGGIEPGEKTALAFTIPNANSEELKHLQLEIRPMRPPLYTQWYIPLDIKGMPAHLQILLAFAIFSLLAYAVWYIRRQQRYHHPLVEELSSQPARLLQHLLEALPEAQQRLQDTQNLQGVLEHNNISPQRLQTAIDFNATSPENKAEILAERLHAQLSQPHEQLYWLQLADDFPLDVDDLLLFQPDENLAVEDVPDTLRKLMQSVPNLERPLCLLLGADNEARNRLLKLSAEYTNPMVTLTSRDLTKLLLDEQPQNVLAKIIAEQVSLDQISPYQLGGGVDRETAFFGRRNLITRIMNRAPANYLLVGGRQLGKSSLLKALKRRYDQQADIQCHYLVLKGENLQRDLSDVLQLSAQIPLGDLLRELHQRMQQQRYVFLIDEADDFIRAERKNDYAMLKELRSLSETGQCTFVLAGFWQLYDYAVLDYQSPLKNFGEILHLGELESEACANLATIPMAMMNLHYAAETLVHELVTQTGQRANLIATACHEIINSLPTGQHEITAGDVHRALDSDEVAGKLAGWDSSEPDKTAQQLDRIVVYTGIQLETFSYGELLKFLEQQSYIADANELQRSLDRLKLGFVFGQEKNKRYFFRVPLFKRLLQEDEPEIRLRAELRTIKAQ